jgi:recombination protein RecA
MRLGQGRENSKQFLCDNKDVAEEIRVAVLTSKGLIGAKQQQEATASTDGGAAKA